MAKIPKPPFKWRITNGPWFSNAVATLCLDKQPRVRPLGHRRRHGRFGDHQGGAPGGLKQEPRHRDTPARRCLTGAWSPARSGRDHSAARAEAERSRSRPGGDPDAAPVSAGDGRCRYGSRARDRVSRTGRDYLENSARTSASWSTAQRRSSSEIDHRRGEPDRRAVGVLGQHAAGHQRLGDLPAGRQGRVDVDARPQPAPAYGDHAVADQRRAAARAAPRRARWPAAWYSPVFSISMTARADRAGQRVAAEGGAVLARA